MNTANFLAIPASIVPDQEILVFEGARFTYAQMLARVGIATRVETSSSGPGFAGPPTARSSTRWRGASRT